MTEQDVVEGASGPGVGGGRVRVGRGIPGLIGWSLIAVVVGAVLVPVAMIVTGLVEHGTVSGDFTSSIYGLFLWMSGFILLIAPILWPLLLDVAMAVVFIVSARLSRGNALPLVLVTALGVAVLLWMAGIGPLIGLDLGEGVWWVVPPFTVAWAATTAVWGALQWRRERARGATRS